MSKYIYFTKLKHLIFINGRSSTEVLEIWVIHACQVQGTGWLSCNKEEFRRSYAWWTVVQDVTCQYFDTLTRIKVLTMQLSNYTPQDSDKNPIVMEENTREVFCQVMQCRLSDWYNSSSRFLLVVGLHLGYAGCSQPLSNKHTTTVTKVI
jgi:hypothetical protein